MSTPFMSSLCKFINDDRVPVLHWCLIIKVQKFIETERYRVHLVKERHLESKERIISLVIRSTREFRREYPCPLGTKNREDYPGPSTSCHSVTWSFGNSWVHKILSFDGYRLDHWRGRTHPPVWVEKHCRTVCIEQPFGRVCTFLHIRSTKVTVKNRSQLTLEVYLVVFMVLVSLIRRK